MAWVKLDDTFSEHRKILAAGSDGLALWVCGLAYCNRQKEHDGFIPEIKVAMLYPVKNARKVAERLVSIGLWERGDGGYFVHDYHDYQPSPEKADDIRAKRAEAGRAGGKRSGETRSNREATAKQIASTNEANGEANTQQHGEAKTKPGPARPVPEPSASAKQRETRVPRDPPPSGPPAGDSGSKPAGPEPVDPPNLKRETTEAVTGGMGHPDHDAAREIHEHYRSKFAEGVQPPSWNTCREAIVRAVVWCRHDGLEPLATLRRVVDYCADPKTEWRSRGQGTADRLFKVRSIFGDAEHCAETLGTLVAESAAWTPSGAAKINPEDLPLSAWKLDDIILLRPKDWRPELYRREPDLARWPDYWLGQDPEDRVEWDRRQAAKRDRNGLRAVTA